MMTPLPLLISTFASSALLASAAQPPQSPGLRVYAPLMSTDTFAVDVNGQTVHTWPAAATPGVTAYIEDDGTLLRTVGIAGGPAVAGRGGGIQRIALDGAVTWDFQIANANRWAHIDIEPMPNGNVLMLVWERLTANDAVAAGRDPSLLASTDWLPDAIVEVEQTGPTTGNTVWEWRFMDHVIQDFDQNQANFGVVANHPELLDINYPPIVSGNGEWNHLNAIDYQPESDLILINSPFQNEFWIIDHSTTTVEAAGHTGGNHGRGGDILYRWGNPAAYRAGTSTDQKLFFQHSTKFVQAGRPGAGNVLVFNNRAGTPLGLNYSSVVEIQLPASFAVVSGQPFAPATFLREYTEPVPADLYSALMSSVERLPNGNTLVSSAQQGGYTFELDPTWTTKSAEFTPLTPGQLVFQCSYLHDQFMWADSSEVSVSTGGTVQFDIIAGGGHANDSYLVVGSASGTSPGLSVGGLTLPLNVDGYFLATISQANRGPFGNTESSLNAMGRAVATFSLPGGLLPPAAAGLELNHACVVFDGQQFTRTSSARKLTWIP